MEKAGNGGMLHFKRQAVWMGIGHEQYPFAGGIESCQQRFDIGSNANLVDNRLLQAGNIDA